MITEVLNVWGNGSITLPKEWRDKYPTRHFLAQEQKDGSLVIHPILYDDVAKMCKKHKRRK